jgi:hypothetical protein
MSDRMGSDLKLEEPRVGNIMGEKKVEANAAQDYYTYKIRQDKLADAVAQGIITDGESKSIRSLGDVEKWELKALARLNRLSDNSPALLQYYQICKASSRDEVAKKLARKQYRKQLVEDALSKLLDPSEVKASVTASADSSNTRSRQQAFGL